MWLNMLSVNKWYNVQSRHIDITYLRIEPYVYHHFIAFMLSYDDTEQQSPPLSATDGAKLKLQTLKEFRNQAKRAYLDSQKTF